MSLKASCFILLFTLITNWPAGVLAQSGAWTMPSRLTHMGPDLDRNFDAREPDIAYNSINNEYLVVWEGTDQRSGLAPGEAEIYGQRVAADSGILLGEPAFRISFLGPDGTANFDARNPVVTYNPTHNEYLVAWSGDDDSGALTEGEFEIFTQRIDGATGALVGPKNMRISDMGPDGNRSYDAIDPAVVYNVTEDVYLVVWRGEEGNASAPIGQFEIYGQLLDGGTGSEVGENDFRISSMGPQNDANFDAFSPAVAFNETDNEFLVVWHGDDDAGALVDDELEVFAQRLDGATGVLLGPGPIRVSDAGDDGDTLREATQPDVAWNRDRDEYLIVWSANDDAGGRPIGEFEIYGQLLSSAGAEIGENDFPVSKMGGVGNAAFDAFEPVVAYHGAAHQFVAAWRGDDTVDGEFEIWSQRLDGPTLTPIGTPGQRLTHAGPDDNLLYDARRVAITEDAAGGRIFIAFELEDETAEQTEGEFEVYGASLGASEFRIADGLSASWFDPTHDGEGWVVELIDADTAAVYWFTYDPNVAAQAWMLGVGSISDNRVVMTDVVLPTGGVFGPDFDPADVQFDKWGSFAIEFESCDAAAMNYNSILEDFGAGALSPVRLSSLAGLECPTPAAIPDASAGISGSWFDPAHDGEGWVLESLGDGRIVMYWFTYDDTGKQAWFIGVGTISGSVVTFDDVLIASGTRFGDNFDPQSVMLDHWGTVTLTVSGCNSITVDYASTDARYGTGQLNARRLISLKGLGCSESP